MERGEIWLVSLDPTAGHEQQGTRPVLIVTPAAFNRVTRLPVVVPVTSGGNFARTAGFAVSVHYSDLNMGFEGQLDENVRFRALKPLLSHHSGDSQTLFG
nr:type II toxin-antitoxin system PemK/MazF family toxin [Escherichia coli]